VVHFIATFHPQAWQRDWAIDVDPEGEQSWDCSDFLAAGVPAWRERVLAKSNSDEGDQLRDDPNAPAWIRRWSGPFWIELVADSS
jgi:hypothetical protein